MSRAFCIPGIVFLFIALALQLLVSISLPFITVLDVVRIHFPTEELERIPNLPDNLPLVSETRLGIWSFCHYDLKDKRQCLPRSGGGYEALFQLYNTENSQIQDFYLKKSWTRGLAIHPVATAVTAIAFGMAFSESLFVTLLSSITAMLAAALTLIAFICDIALYAHVKKNLDNYSRKTVNTDTGPAFWMAFVSLIFLLLGAFTVCFGRRRTRGSASYPAYPMSATQSSGGFLSRFRK